MDTMDGRRAIAPEFAVAGFTRFDGSIAFYAQVHELAREATRILDIGAGRGAWCEDPVQVRRDLHDLRGEGREVIGIDVDAAVEQNPGIDQGIAIEPGAPWPVEDSSIDLAVCDWVLEHVEDPGGFTAELDRVLRPGAWFCARTTNANGYVALGARLIPERLHASVLRRVKPGHREEDTFPTVFRMNTPRRLRQAFDPARWELILAPTHPEPTYTGGKRWVTRAIHAGQRFVPVRFGATIFVFARRADG